MKTFLSLVGNTPLLQLTTFERKDVRIFVKAEMFNPSGSVKDRVALKIIQSAEKNKSLTKDKVILEATSGNMGISLAMAGAQLGYRVMIVMSDSVSIERRSLVRAYGAKLILTPGAQGTFGALRYAQNLVEKNKKYWFVNQFYNENNVMAHYEHTAQEIVKQVDRVDYLVSGVGTGGTLIGIGKRLKELYPRVKVIGVLPPRGFGVQGIQNPLFDFHGDIFDATMVDKYISVSHKEAFSAARKLSRSGYFVGMSSGANISAVLKLVEKGMTGSFVTVFPDGGEKYLSTDLYS